MPNVTLNDEEVTVMRAVLASLAVNKDKKLILRDDESSTPYIVQEARLKTLNSIRKKIKLKGIIIPEVD